MIGTRPHFRQCSNLKFFEVICHYPACQIAKVKAISAKLRTPGMTIPSTLRQVILWHRMIRKIKANATPGPMASISKEAKVA